MKESELVIGKRYFSYKNEPYYIVEKSNDCSRIYFPDTGNFQVESNISFRANHIRDFSRKHFFGVGYVSSTKEAPFFYKERKEKSFVRWLSLLERCYGAKKTGALVCDEWHDYSNFKKWYLKNKPLDDAFELDKDLLSKERKIYSPETCCFLPTSINTTLRHVHTPLSDTSPMVIVKLMLLTSRCKNLLSPEAKKALYLMFKNYAN